MNNLHLHKVHFCPQIAGAKSRQAEIIGAAVSNKLQIQSNQVKRTPQEPINEFVIQKVESFASCRFQIDLCILVCVISREFTREEVMRFLPAPFS